jgi:hypothetical protein
MLHPSCERRACCLGVSFLTVEQRIPDPQLFWQVQRAERESRIEESELDEIEEYLLGDGRLLIN